MKGSIIQFHIIDSVYHDTGYAVNVSKFSSLYEIFDGNIHRFDKIRNTDGVFTFLIKKNVKIELVVVVGIVVSDSVLVPDIQHLLVLVDQQLFELVVLFY